MDEEKTAYWLDMLIEKNIDKPNNDDIAFIRSLWDNEEWSSIVRKWNSIGSEYYVWWEDGIRTLEKCPHKHSCGCSNEQASHR
jgi:redox-regulated HSP33 family molecular chaperone